MKLNKYKKTILNILKDVTSHPTADWIYSEVKKKIPQVSLGTIYRNLNLLTENDYILKLDYSGVMSRFDGNPEAHPHIVCKNCGKVDDIELKPNNSIIGEAETISGYKIQDYRLEFAGICADCK